MVRSQARVMIESCAGLLAARLGDYYKGLDRKNNDTSSWHTNNWNIRLDDNSSWMSCGTSNTTVYVLYNTPSIAIHNLTLVDIGCRNAANATDEPTVNLTTLI